MSFADFIEDVPPVHNAQEVFAGLWVGSAGCWDEIDALKRRGVRRVLCCASELTIPAPIVAAFTCKSVPLANSAEEDLEPHFADCVRFMAAEPTLVHCQMGVCRAPAVAIAFLIVREHLGFDDALRLVRQSRPIAGPNQNFEAQLRELERWE